MRIYLDANATTAIDPAVQEVVVAAFSAYGNPSSIHAEGQRAKALLAEARALVAAFFGVRPSEVIFTASGSEANNLILRGVIPGHIVTSNVEHASTAYTLLALERAGSSVTTLDAGRYGCVTPEQVAAAVRPDTRLIALVGANNETGVLLDIPAIAALAAERKIPLMIDAISLIGKEQFIPIVTQGLDGHPRGAGHPRCCAADGLFLTRPSAARLAAAMPDEAATQPLSHDGYILPAGVTALTLASHKIHGPKGAGVAIVRERLKLQPWLTGGPQEHGLRGGTENLPAIVGCAKAIEQLREMPWLEPMRALRDRFEQELVRRCGARVNGTGPRVANVTNLCFPGADGELLLMQLDQRGIAASHGSACASGGLEPSRVLLAMGLSRDEARASLRFSLSRHTTPEEIERAIEIVAQLTARY